GAKGIKSPFTSSSSSLVSDTSSTREPHQEFNYSAAAIEKTTENAEVGREGVPYTSYSLPKDETEPNAKPKSKGKKSDYVDDPGIVTVSMPSKKETNDPEIDMISRL